MKILIMNTTGLGNILLFLPAYHYLIENIPDVEVTVVYDSKWFGDEFMHYQFKEAKRFVYYPANKKRIFSLFLCYLKIIKQKYDYILIPYTGITFRRLLSFKFIRSRNKIYFTEKFKKWKNFIFIEDKPNEHYVVKNKKQVEYILRHKNDKIPFENKKYIRIENLIDEKKINNKLWIGFHPGGNVQFNPYRQWPSIYYKALVKLLTEVYQNNLHIFIFGRGCYEDKLIDFIMEGQEKIVTKVLNHPLKDVALKIKNCDIFVGNDSGLMHLASGLGVKTLGLFGPTNPLRTGPFGEITQILRVNLDCSPCFNFGSYKSCEHFSCLWSIKPENVYKKLNKMLKQ